MPLGEVAAKAILKTREEKKIKCPVCHTKVVPLHMERRDTLTLNSSDGYLLRDSKCGANRGIVQVTCYSCGYVIGEYKY